MMSESELEKRVKRSLRVQDQTDNMKRILNQQKQYKMILVQDMLHKDKKIRDFTEFRKSLAVPQVASVSMRNQHAMVGGLISKSQQNFPPGSNSIPM